MMDFDPVMGWWVNHVIGCGTYGTMLPDGKQWRYDATKNAWVIEDIPPVEAPFVDDVYSRPEPMDESARQARIWELLVQSAR